MTSKQFETTNEFKSASEEAKYRYRERVSILSQGGQENESMHEVAYKEFADYQKIERFDEV
jgi:hypothetical protein